MMRLRLSLLPNENLLFRWTTFFALPFPHSAPPFLPHPYTPFHITFFEAPRNVEPRPNSHTNSFHCLFLFGATMSGLD